MINIISSSRYRINRRVIRHTVETLFTKKGLDVDTLNIVFIGRTKMKAIATKYKEEPVALPVLSFGYDDNPDGKTLAEIVICYPQAVLLAAEREKRVDDMIGTLVKHGIDTLYP